MSYTRQFIYSFEIKCLHIKFLNAESLFSYREILRQCSILLATM